MTFSPYLFFGGSCRDAFTRYQEIFGGDLNLVTGADMPAEDGVPPENADYIMNAALTSEGQLLMGSDDPTGGYSGMQGIMVNHTVADVAEAERVFDALADGGEVRMPLSPTSWSPRFGMCVDRFGTPWMVNVEQQGT